MKLGRALLLIALMPPLAGCEQLGLENQAAEQAREEAEGKAVGGGCRQTARPLEECYQNNRKSSKAAIYAGWRDMDAYMRENKIEEIKADSPMKLPPGSDRPPESAGETADAGPKPTQKNEAATTGAATGKDEKTPETKAVETLPARKARPALSR
ncbi:MAG: hypothetical protein IPK39_10670 [Sulfuritalea sp.]|nr:hypothetical protein [Sulfuritalea sp.]